jgi:hypothetical protein
VAFSQGTSLPLNQMNCVAGMGMETPYSSG